MKLLSLILLTLFSFIGYAQDLNEVQKQQVKANYLKNGGFENGKTGWATYSDAAGTSPVDGTGGSPNVTLTTNTMASTTNPHDGKVSAIFTKDAANRQGQGFSYNFSIPDIAKGKVNRMTFSYEVTSGTYANGDMSVWIYDVTNARLIQPSSYTIEASSLKESKFVEWQSSIDSNSYRLIVHVTSTSASAFTLKLDLFDIGLGPKIWGSITSDEIAYTPTVTGFGTVTNLSAFYRRNGNFLEGRVTFTEGSVDGNLASVTLPSGASIDTGKVTLAANTSSPCPIYGSHGNTNAGGGGFALVCSLTSTTTIYFGNNFGNTATTTITPRPGNIIGSTSGTFTANFRVPIQGWSSSQQLSQDASGRVITARMHRSSDVSIPNSTETKITLNASTFDDVGGFDSVNNRYVAREAGKYRVNGSIGWDSNGTGVRVAALRKNGTEVARTQSQPNGASATMAVVSDIISLNAGDYVELYGVQTSGGSLNIFGFSSYTFMAIEKIAGPSQILASEFVGAKYTSSSGQNIPSATRTLVDFSTKEYDSHNAVTTGGSWKYTAPISGTYRISTSLAFGTGNFGINNVILTEIRKNGSIIQGYDNVVQNGYTGAYNVPPVVTTVKLLQGEYLDATIYQNSGGGRNLVTSGIANHIEIERIGSY